MGVIDDALSRKKQQNHSMDYMWYVIMPSLSSFAAPGIMLTPDPSRYTYASEIPGDPISHRVYSIDTPYTQFDTGKVTEAGSFWYTATHSDIGPVTLRVDEMEDGLTMKYFNDWKSLIKNPDGTHNPPAVFKRNIEFYQLRKNKTEMMKSTYTGYFPTEINPFSWSMDGNSVTQYSIVLTGDDVKHEIIPVSNGAGGVIQQANLNNTPVGGGGGGGQPS